MVALLTSVRNSPCFGGLPRTKTCHRQLFARPSTCFLVTFCTMQKVTIRLLRREIRGSANLESAHPNKNFPLTKLKPSQRENQGFSNLNSARRNGGFALTKLNPFAAFWRHCFCCCRNKSLPLRGFFRRLRRLSNFPFGKFVEVLQTSNQHTQTTVNLIKIRKIHINPLKISL